MNLQDLGSLGEFISGVAVVVSLVYLAVQIRQNSRESRAATYQGLSSLFVSTINNVASNPELARVYNAGLRNFDELKEEAERTQFSLSVHAAFVSFENAFYLHRYGTLEEELWAKWRSQVQWYAKRAGVVTWWELSQRFFSEAFRQYVNELISSGRDARQ